MALPSSTSSSSLNVLNSDDLVSATTDEPTDEDKQCRICHEDTTGMEEDHLVRCNSKHRHPHCMRCYAENHIKYKFDPTTCLRCHTKNTIDVTTWTPEQKAFHAQCQAEFGMGGEGETEIE